MSAPVGREGANEPGDVRIGSGGGIRVGMVVAAVAAVAVLPMFVIDFPRLFLPLAIDAAGTQQDYWAFYAGARAAWTGLEGNLYDPTVFAAYLGVPSTLLWLYPPTLFLLLAPFGVVSYGVAKVAWVAMALASTVVLVRAVAPSYRAAALALLSPLGWVSLFVGQFGAIFGLWLVAGLTQAKRRPFLAGACIALLTVKPQYGLLIIPFLVAVRAWRALRWATVLGIVFHLATWAAFGSRAWGWFLASIGGGTNAVFMQSRGHNGRITAMDAGSALGLPLPAQWLVWGALVLSAVAGLAALRRRASTELLVAYTLAATACIAPYFWAYDYFVVYAALLIVAVRGPRATPLQTGVLAAAWIAPAVPFFAGSALVPAFLWPLNVLAALVIFRMAMGGTGHPTPSS